MADPTPEKRAVELLKRFDVDDERYHNGAWAEWIASEIRSAVEAERAKAFDEAAEKCRVIRENLKDVAKILGRDDRNDDVSGADLCMRELIKEAEKIRARGREARRG